MAINTEIWGTPETWINAPYTTGESGALAESLKITAPKCPDFGTESNKTRLNSGITNGRITANEPLDLSICPCGQDEKVSAYGKLAIFNENGDGSLIPRVVERNTPCNWFMFDQYESYNIEKMVIKRNYSYSSSRGMKFDQWSPNAVINSYNNNGYISPFVFWYTRSIVLAIQVKAFTSAGNSGTNGGWISLDAWKNSYSNENICGIRFITMPINALNSQTMTLTYYNSTPSQYQHAGKIAILDTIPNINNNGTPTDTTFYSFFQTSDRGREGVIFDETYGSGNTTNMCILPCWEYFDGQTINRGGNSSWGYYYYYSIPYSDATYEKIMKLVACFGCYFTPSSKTSFPYAMTDADLCLPIIDENGITHGEYTRGADNVNNDLYEMDGLRDIDYNPYKPPSPIDTNTYSITTGFNTVGNVASTTKQYVINANALQGLSSELWTVVGNLITDPDDIKNLDNLSLDAFLTNNPIDAIVSVKKYPLSSVPHAESLENIYLGKYQSGAAGYALAMQQARYNFEGIPIFPKFGNCFLDYAPYTKMQLYIPFCGTIEIDSADFMGRTLSVEMVMDFITGTVTAYVLANQLVVTSITGNCAIDIPITGTEQATVNSAYESATIAERQARKNEIMQTVGIFTHPIKTATKPLTTAAERVSTALDRAQREYELTHINLPLRQIGQASPLNSWALEFVCRLIIYYPDGECISFNATNEPSLITEKVEAFGAVNGFATVETDKLSNFTGFTQVSDADLTGIAATDTEKNMILNLLQSGIYI